jgi:hypothetical protein
MFEREVSKAIRNIHVSKAISKIEGKSQGYLIFLGKFAHKYGESAIKAALEELYTYNREIYSIERLTVATIMKYSHL